MFAGKKSAQIREILISESAWEEMTCLFAPSLAGASLKESDLSRGVFSEDVWGQFSLQGANLCHAELDGLDPRKVDTSGIKIAAWQQELILEALGIVVYPD